MAVTSEPWIRRYWTDVVRVVGLVLGVVLVLAPVVSDVKPTDVAGGYSLVIGMIFLGTFFGKDRNGRGGNGSGRGGPSS